MCDDIDGNRLNTWHKKFSAAMATKQILVIGEYKNIRAPVDLSCGICGAKWAEAPRYTLQNGCPDCKNRNVRKNASFRLWQRTQAILKDKQGKADSNETSSIDDSFVVTCKLGHKFTTSHRYLRRNRWCPVCQKVAKYTAAFDSTAVYGNGFNNRIKTQRHLIDLCNVKGARLHSTKQPNGLYKLACIKCGDKFERTIRQILRNVYLCPNRCIKGKSLTYGNVGW